MKNIIFLFLRMVFEADEENHCCMDAKISEKRLEIYESNANYAKLGYF